MKKIISIALTLATLFSLTTLVSSAASLPRDKNKEVTVSNVKVEAWELGYISLSFETKEFGNITIDNASRVAEMFWFYEGEGIARMDNEIQYYNDDTFGLVYAPAGKYMVNIITKDTRAPYFKVNGKLVLNLALAIRYVIFFGWLFG